MLHERTDSPVAPSHLTVPVLSVHSCKPLLQISGALFTAFATVARGVGIVAEGDVQQYVEAAVEVRGV